MVYKLHDASSILNGERFILLSETQMLQGRAKLTVKRKTIVTGDNVNAEVKDSLLQGDTLAKKQFNYTVIESPHASEKHYDHDIELLDIDKWESHLGDDKLYANGLYSSPHGKEFSKRKRVQTFNKMVISFLQKYNNPQFDRKEFYKEQERGGLGYLGKSGLQPNYKKSKENSRELHTQEEAKLYDKIVNEGGTWSAKYNDRQLAQMLNKYSLVREKERRNNLLAHDFDYQAFVGFGLNLINNENINDAETTQQSRYDIELGLEYYFFRNYDRLKYFTMEFSGRKANDAYFGGELNVRSTEYSLATHLNWYPFRQPHAINVNIVYIGILFRYGIASLSNVSTGEVGNYQIFTFPGLRAGLKYNFNNSFGLRVTGGFENIISERVVRDDDLGTLPNRTNYLEAKIGVSLSKFF
ncbi:MAG: hypothetical protein HON90_10795, partial [Halobacteriovoraceae bacterium]|nr:hypothetical protein [Halobacteriovoraceae bacterium]